MTELFFTRTLKSKQPTIFFVFDGETMFLIDKFLVIAYLLLNYHVGNQIALSEHPFVNL